jgi:hypothetical protein
VTHPTLSADGVSRFVTEILVREDIDEDRVTTFLAEHAENLDSIDLTEVDAVGASIAAVAMERGVTDRKLESLENEFAGPVHAAMSALPLEALGDVRFWSFCAARCFWRFILLRQHKSVIEGRRRVVRSMLESSPDEGERVLPLNRYVLGRDHYQIPLRLFLRAQAVGDDQDFLDEHLLPEGTDFWRSHILGVRTGAYPTWARALVEAQYEQQLKIEEQRPPARRINRLRVNVSPILHDESEAAAIIAPYWVKSSSEG